MTTASTHNQRLDYIDAVRAFALLLGIVFHASLSFVPIYIGWAVMDISTSNYITTFILISHSFRMPLFFFVAGLFAHMAISKKGTRSILSSRLMRLGLPLVAGWFILRPLLVSGWIMGMQSLQGDVDITSSLRTSFEGLLELPEGFLIGTHLWFLYYLLIITFIAVVFSSLIKLISHKLGMQPSSLKVSTRSLFQNKSLIIVLAIPASVAIWFMERWGLDTPDKSLLPHWPVLAMYGGCFAIGWLTYRNEDALAQFSTITPSKLLIALLSVLACVLLAEYESQPAHEYYQWFKAAFSYSYGVMMWSLVFLSLGACRKLFSKTNGLVRYFADASYWLYLIHLPIVIWLQVAVAELPWHWSLKLTVVCVTTMLMALVIYDLLVRSTWLGKLLNGKRYGRCIFNFAKSQRFVTTKS